MQAMKVSQTLFIIIFCTTSLIAQELSLATFNCEFLSKKKVHIKYGLPYSLKDASKAEQKFWESEANLTAKFQEASNAVAKQIKLIDADIIGLTEVGKAEELEILVKALKKLGLDYPYWKVGKSTDYATGQHVAILSKYELKNIETSFEERGLFFTETDKDETGQTGISKGMKASVVFNGEEINIFLVHFKSEAGGEEADQQRIMQAEIIRRVTIPYLQEGRHVVIMGDFNSGKRHKVLLNLRGFNDIFEELIQTGDSYYFKEKNSSRWTYEYLGEREQIDHILLSLPLSRKCYTNGKSRFGIESTIVLTENELVSDHNAFKVKLSFKK